MKNCAFTIVAKNYIGLAQILEKSFKTHNPNADFYIFIADVPDQQTPPLEPNIIVAKDALSIDSKDWTDMCFKYNLTEFCTAIKPKCFEWVFSKKNVLKAIYLDPDIYCYSSFDEIFENLEKYSIILSPHITTIEQNKYSGDLPENIFLWSGTFNLGFLALKNHANSKKLLTWWNRKLINECFFDNNRFTATDQKWMVYTPMFFDRETLLIDHDMGIDAAPWNFFEREFYDKAGQVWVRNRIDNSVEDVKLKFVHFSNYKYSELTQGVITHYILQHSYSDLDVIFIPYVNAMVDSSVRKYLPLKYSYNTFDNGQPISLLNRRIYRRITLDCMEISNPFATDPDSFYDTLRKRKLLTKGSAVTSTVRGGVTVCGVGRTVKLFDMICRVVKRVMGVDRYEQFIRFTCSRLVIENQSHLYDKKSRKNL